MPKGNGSSFTGSDISLGQARQWLSECLNGHAECTWHAKSNGLPTRLLHIDESGSHVRLCLRDEIPPETRYLSLSHCWGKHQPLKLESKKFSAFRSSIPLADLPKTFREAISVVRFLGLSYIWIDSLCIIQDDKEDWRRECTVMGLVYRSALAKIAATAARDGTVGCFFHRAPNLLEPFVITAETHNATTHFATQSNASNGLFGAHSPLYQRGWAIQEWYMALRILHFGRDTVFWECISSAASEAFPVMDDSRRTKAVVELLSKASYRNLDAIQSASELMEAWSKLVQVYSKAQLTHSTDKLPAFSAIAREMAERWARLRPGEEVTYLAGMWSKFLPQQLLWTLTRPNNGWSTAPARPPGRNVAPSWSWVSVDMAVHTANWSPLREKGGK